MIIIEEIHLGVQEILWSRRRKWEWDDEETTVVGDQRERCSSYVDEEVNEAIAGEISPRGRVKEDDPRGSVRRSENTNQLSFHVNSESAFDLNYYNFNYHIIGNKI